MARLRKYWGEVVNEAPMSADFSFDVGKEPAHVRPTSRPKMLAIHCLQRYSFERSVVWIVTIAGVGMARS